MNGELIEALGLLTYICLWITVIMGLSLWKFRIRFIRPWMHYLMAGITLLFATTHLTTILVLAAD